MRKATRVDTKARRDPRGRSGRVYELSDWENH